VQISDCPLAITPPRGKGRIGFRGVLRLESREVAADVRVIPASTEKVSGPGPGKPEQRVVDEFDGRRRPLDVQQDGADLRQVDAVRSGM
jgi:hypothetical protein